MTAIPALGRLKQENYKLEASLGYIARPSLKNTRATEAAMEKGPSTVLHPFKD
jgi:hypothetical protein